MTTTFTATQNAEALYTSPLRTCDPEFSDALVGAADIAQLLKVPISWVYERTRRRGIERMPHFKLGKYLRFSKQEVSEWVRKSGRN